MQVDRIHPRRRGADRRHPARHPRPPRAVLRGEAHRRRDRQEADRLGHPGPPRPRHAPAWSASCKTAASDARRRPARRHGRAADHRAQHASRTRAQHARQDARVRPRRPHRDAAGRRQAPVAAPQLRRHGLPDLPAGRGRRRRRARDDRGRPVRAVPDGGGLRRAQLAGHEGRPVRAARPGRCSRRATSSGSPSAARARTPRCRTTASTRCRWPARWCRRSRPSSRRNKRPIDAGRDLGHR